jgi:hypothetical protein
MFSKTLFLVFAAATSVQAAAIVRRIPPALDPTRELIYVHFQVRQNGPPPPPVFTATRVYQTITNRPPYIITATTTMTWTWVSLFSSSTSH